MLTKICKRSISNAMFAGRNFSTIGQIKAREIIDSRGNPTVEADVILTNG